MGQSKVKGYGSRGWILIIWIATAFLSYLVIGNYPLNILSDLYGGQAVLSSIYTVASIIGVIVQLIASNFIGKLKSIKKMGCLMGALSIVALLGIMFIPGYIPGATQMLWRAVYGLGTVLSLVYATFSLSILVGQWFPTRKGSVMGIATFAFPLGNGVIGVFAATAFKGGQPHIANAFAPFLIIFIVGLILGIIFVPDYPEEVGAFRDNNPNMTPEMAKTMMLEEIENKKTTVWKLNHTLTTRDFWFITIPAGCLLMFSVGMMTQTNAILGSMGNGLAKFGGFAGVMLMICIFGLIGSFALGVLDTKFGTKKAMIIACIIMLLAGILGALSSPEKPGLLVASLVCLALFMGASSNFTVSLAAQYWRREDFGTVFAAVNPIANLISSLGPVIIAMIMIACGYNMIFVVTAIVAVICIILMLLFSAKHVKEKDDTYRTAAGKKLDNALEGRK
ncbi:MFS transporter [uncultured Eubacterium sp.]|uniref:MFS transporter n=1 Tax=uncultured Eubacterium sp. TaxID=165185 RepID=UPI002599341E|nr:MFS transporter [uncultured Eubacterium sp.]